jgi:hypothetical protein
VPEDYRLPWLKWIGDSADASVETDEHLAAIRSVDAAVALLDTPVSNQLSVVEQQVCSNACRLYLS